jgi:hypothetical protein
MHCGRVLADVKLLSRRLSQTAPAQNFRSFDGVRRNATALVWLLVVAAIAGASADGNLPLAIYLLSFLYYGLYWWAFAFGVASFDAFKRDAMVLKAIAVIILAFLYLREPLDFASLGVIAAGILLNVRAAIALGLDRTYYGHELAGLPSRRVGSFPYSLTAHPMILGNLAAFGGTLINPLFREAWWPLAGLHVALNLGLLAMELAGPRRRRIVRIGGGLVLAGAYVAATLAGLATSTEGLP